MSPTLLAEYVLPPGVCFLCRASRRPNELIVDTGLMVDANMGDPNSPQFGSGVREEPVVICGSCITEMGSMIGMASEGRVTAANADVIMLRAELEQARAKVADLEAALDALGRARYGTPSPAEWAGFEPAAEIACGESGCERVFPSEHALSVHIGKSHKEHA